MAMVSIEQLRLVLKSIKNLSSKKADRSDIVQSNWDQNDIESNDYIKNRPFYTTDPIRTPLVENLNIESIAGKTNVVSNSPLLEVGKQYEVVLNGVSYISTAKLNGMGDWIYIGNSSAFTAADIRGEITDDPFFCGTRNGSSCHIQITQPGSYTVTISIVDQQTIEIPEKYISFKPGKTVTGKTFIVDGEEIVAETGAEIFNKMTNIATGMYAHAEGTDTVASGHSAHAEGCMTTASNVNAHAEGDGTVASGENSHSEGVRSKATGDLSHAEGFDTTASDMCSHAEGYKTTASREAAHAEGYGTAATGFYSHSEGYQTLAAGSYSHSEGGETYAYGQYSHAEGYNTTASGDYSHTEGSGNVSQGAYSHSQGCDTRAYGDYSHAEGIGTDASGMYQHVQGRYNIPDEYDEDGNPVNRYAHIVGNGVLDGEDLVRSNAHTLDWEGNAWFAGKVYVGGTSQDDALPLDAGTVMEHESDSTYGHIKINYVVVGKVINLHCEFTPNVDISSSSGDLTWMTNYVPYNNVRVLASASGYATSNTNDSRYAHVLGGTYNGTVVFTGSYTKGATYYADFSYIYV